MAKNKKQKAKSSWLHNGIYVAIILCLALCIFVLTDSSAKAEQNKLIYGVCEHSLTEKDAEAMKQLGIDMLRIDFVWQRIEPSKGKWSFEYYDELVNRAKEYNIGILAILDFCALWASSAPAEAENRDKYPPENIDDYANFVSKVVERYKDEITYWEIWNEPNIEHFWKPSPNATVYTELLKVTYKAVKVKNPNAIVLLGGIAEIDLDFIEKVYKNEGKDFFDIIAVHPYRAGQHDSPYASPTLQYDLNQLKELMDEYGDGDKKVWITEIGWYTSGHNPVSVEKQSEYLKKTYEIVENLGFIDALFWYELRDGGIDPTNKEHNFGLVYRDYEPKPAYYEYKDIIKEKSAKEIEIKEVLTRIIEILNKLIQFYAQLIQLSRD